MPEARPVIQAHVYIELYYEGGYTGEHYDSMWDCLIDCGNNHSQIEEVDTHTLRVYFDNQEHLINAQVALEELQHLPL